MPGQQPVTPDHIVLATDRKFCFTDRAFSELSRIVQMTQKSKEEVVQEFRIASIQDATMRVIARKGMAGATMQEIAEEAGVAKGTIYLYFRDRDELVEKTFQTAITRLMGQVDAAMEQDLPLEAKLRSIMHAHLRFFGENRQFFRVFLSMRVPEGPAAARQRGANPQCLAQYRSRVQRFADALALAMDRGEIRRVDPYKLALFVVEGSTAIILERLDEDAPTPDEADVDLITGLILDGIRERR